MRHRWTYGNKHFNFCSKCGMKKSAAYGRKCVMSPSNYKLKIDHNLKPYVHPFKEYRYHKPTEGKSYLQDADFENSRYQCKKCNVHNNRDYLYAIQWKGNKAFVPYIVYKNSINGNINYKCVTTKKIPNGFIATDILFWPIYCAYTEDEIDVMDIII